MSSNEWNTYINLPNRKLIFSKYVSFLALLNITQDLKCFGSSPTGDWVKTINHSCTFSFSSAFPLHCLFHLAHLWRSPLFSCISTGDQEEQKSRKRDIRSYRINLHFNSTLLPRLQVGRPQSLHFQWGFLDPPKRRYLSYKASNSPHLWEGGAPLASCIRSFGPNWRTTEFVSPFSRAVPNLEKVVFERVGQRGREGDFLQGWSLKEMSTNPFHMCH